MAWLSPKETITLKWSMDDESWSHWAQGRGRQSVSTVVLEGLNEIRRNPNVIGKIRSWCESVTKSGERESAGQGNQEVTHKNQIEIQLPASDWGEAFQLVGTPGDPVIPSHLLAAVILESGTWKQSGNDDAEYASGYNEDRLISSVAISSNLTHTKRLELGRYEKIMATLLVIGTFLIAGAAGLELYRDRGTGSSGQIQRSLIESLGPDENAVQGSLDDPGDDRVPGVPGASLDGDGEADEVSR